MARGGRRFYRTTPKRSQPNHPVAQKVLTTGSWLFVLAPISTHLPELIRPVQGAYITDKLNQDCVATGRLSSYNPESRRTSHLAGRA